VTEIVGGIMKAKRHSEILDIISKSDVCTQEELQLRLCEKGFNVTQATVSRDIRELNLVKRLSGSGVYKYSLPSSRTVKRSIIAEAIIKVDYAMNTVVLKCHSGMAQAACAEIDSMELHGVVGTLAGDDTIFILMKTEHEAEKLSGNLNEIIQR